MKTRSIALALAMCGEVLAAASAHGDMVVSAGSTLAGYYMDGGTLTNDGTVLGEAAGSFYIGHNSRVTGSGHFKDTHIDGVFAPGTSPGISTGTNQAFGGSATVEVELGGLTPGFGAGNHDQINDSATLYLFGGPTLKVMPFNSFVPAPGNQFKVMTWRTGLSGSFGGMIVDSFYLSQGISFTQVITNASGIGDLTLVAVAVPEVSAIWLLTLAVGTSTAIWAAGRALQR
jgi:hypothetical protein